MLLRFIHIQDDFLTDCNLARLQCSQTLNLEQS